LAFWIFKIADQELYFDVNGRKYVYDNTHSVKLLPNDIFLYLDKRNSDDSFSATGIVSRISHRSPTVNESSRTSKVKTVYTAYLKDVLWFSQPMSVASSTIKGKHNRALLGIENANLLGWSRSMPRISESMYSSILNLAEANKLIPLESEK
jgi:hypothetical protein